MQWFTTCTIRRGHPPSDRNMDIRAPAWVRPAPSWRNVFGSWWPRYPLDWLKFLVRQIVISCRTKISFRPKPLGDLLLRRLTFLRVIFRPGRRLTRFGGFDCVFFNVFFHVSKLILRSFSFCLMRSRSRQQGLGDSGWSIPSNEGFGCSSSRQVRARDRPGPFLIDLPGVELP